MTSKDACAISCQLDARVRLAALNASESEALGLMVKNLSTAAIAERLTIDASAVESHRAKILAKLKVETLLQALNLVNTAGRQAN